VVSLRPKKNLASSATGHPAIGERREAALVSAISLVETIYLVERGRIPLEAFRKLEATLRDPASGLIVAPVDEDVVQAVFKIPRQTVPDMPDRIIAATALRHNLPLLTRDARIQAAGIKTIW
jgi:PIN domain nuclease of toxin-antitoxin system